MLRSNRVKIFLFLAAAIFQGCAFWRAETSAPTGFPAGETKSEIPFLTKEPEVYQAEIVLTNYAGGEKTERKIFTAKNGEKLRSDYESKISFLQRGAGEKFLIHSGKKIYADGQTNSNITVPTGEGLQDFLTNKWLNEKANAKFESLGAENGLTKYRVVLEGSQTSEILIYIDENLKIPVRQEFYSTGEQRKMFFSMEIRNLKFEADEKLFELPKDFRKVSAEEFQKVIWREKFDSEK